MAILWRQVDMKMSVSRCRVREFQEKEKREKNMGEKREKKSSHPE